MNDQRRIESFEDLIVWQKAVDVADLVLEMTESGPLSGDSGCAIRLGMPRPQSLQTSPKVTMADQGESI